MAKTMAEEITAAERMAEQTLSDAEKKALAKRLAKELKKHPLLVLEGDHFTNGRKIAYLTLFLGTGIYRQCVRALFRKRNL